MKPSKQTLEELYLKQRLTTRRIGSDFGVSKTSVMRWLKGYSIPLRASNSGLENRGIAPPTADELHHMIHVLHIGYEGVAAKYGVDSTAVAHWLRKHGMRRPTAEETRSKGRIKSINVERAVELYTAGASTRQLSETFGVNASRITTELRAAGCAIRKGGFNRGARHICNDGHSVMSLYEKRVDDWLSFHGYAHEVEPRLPFNRRSKGDFLVGDTYIEIWGVQGSSVYTERKERKTKQYHEHGLKLVELSPHHFDVKRKKRFDTILAKALAR